MACAGRKACGGGKRGCGQRRTKLLGIAIVLLVVIAAAIAVTMVILSVRPPPPQNLGDRRPWTHVFNPLPVGQKKFLIVIGDQYGSHESRSESGEIIGFGPQMVELICEEAGIDCELVYLKYRECWVTGSSEKYAYGGRALLSNWYDACLGWFVTLHRLTVFTFGHPYIEPEYGYMFYRKGSNFDPYNIEGKTIGFILGWAHDEICLAHKDGIKGRNLATGRKIYHESIQDAVNDLVSNKTDAFIAPWHGMHVYTKTKPIEHAPALKFTCMLDGQALMTRKDSDLPALWNIGYQKARYKGRFHRICEDANIKYYHLGRITCEDEWSN